MLSNDARLALEVATETYSQQIDEAGRYLTSRGITKDAAAQARFRVPPDDRPRGHDRPSKYPLRDP